METTSKTLLRKQYMALRRALAPEAVEALNSGLLKQVRALDWSKLSALHTFLPIAAQNEPDTFRIIAWLRDEHPGVRIVVPRVADGAGGTLVHHLLDERTVLVKNQWGIPEPTDGERVEPRNLDAVLVPLLAFDLAGNRVGYGQGFYDRFLSACQPGVLKIGLSFFDPVPRIADVLETDMPLDAGLTPARTYWFSSAGAFSPSQRS